MKKRVAIIIAALLFVLPCLCFASFPEDAGALVQDSDYFKDTGFDSASNILSGAKNKSSGSFVLVYYSRFDKTSKALMPYVRSFADENKTTVYGIDQYNKYTQEYGYFNKNTTLVGWESFIDKRSFSFPAVFAYNADVRKTFTLSGASSAMDFTGLLSEAGLMQSPYHETVRAESAAESLSGLGLFKGTGDGFELLKKPTRAEALVMLIRLLGKEEEALAFQGASPFTDVPSWAKSYVSYAYGKGITTGVSKRRCGANDEVTAEQYLTFVLRALSYKSGEAGDFLWNAPFELAMTAGVLPDGVNTSEFLRADMVLVTYSALTAKLKASELMLCEKLVDDGVITSAALYEKTGVESRIKTPAPPVEEPENGQ
ncbi:MAG: S-layer homology domain-containing protein [Clostridia bacterium]|nr:S-layer homology domain-containing protein [Clostridia bacterium]